MDLPHEIDPRRVWRASMPDVLYRMVAPPDVAGALDWISGIILINASLDYYEAVLARDDAEAEDMRGTVLHEVTHFQQMLIFGFLHQWLAHLAELFGRIEKRLREQWPPDEQPAMHELVERAGALVGDADVAALAALVTEMEWEDDAGLSARTIVEGHALYVELCTGRSLDGPAFARLLDERQTPPGYRRSFDILAARLGQAAAFEALPFVSALALCSSDPVVSFHLLAERWQSTAGELSLTTAIRECCAFGYLGSPVDTRFMRETCAPYVEALDAVRAAAEIQFHLLSYFHDPTRYSRRLMSLATPSMLFAPDASGDHHVLAGRRPAEPEDAHRMVRALFTAALFRSLHDGLDEELLQPGADVLEGEVDTYRLLAFLGDTDGVFNLGITRTRARDYAAAEAWWRVGSALQDRGCGHALTFLLAVEGRLSGSFTETQALVMRPVDADRCLELGDGVEHSDPDLAVVWWLAAFRRGNLAGAYRAGRALFPRIPYLGSHYLRQVELRRREEPSLAREAHAVRVAAQRRMSWREKHRMRAQEAHVRRLLSRSR